MPNGSIRMAKIVKEGTGNCLLNALTEQLQPFSKHLFNAKWQHQQYKDVSTNIPVNSVVFCMDFAENYTSRPQDAPQGCHWNNQQTTIHPIVASYVCQENQCNKIVTDSIVFVSADLTHDHHAVQHFYSQAVQLLQSEDIHFDKVIAFSDGAPTQYKNRIAFADCSNAATDLSIQSERHFFGSRHGKGVIKKSVTRAVAARQVDVLVAADFFQMCSTRLQLPPPNVEHSHTKRRFVYVDCGSINRDRPDRTNTRSVPNTQKIHCVRGIQPFTVSARERSCFCAVCRGNEDGLCKFSDLAGVWSSTLMKPKSCRDKRVVLFILDKVNKC